MAAILPDTTTLEQAGIDPNQIFKAKQLKSYHNKVVPNALKEGIKKQLRIVDEQTHCNKGQWFNIPANLSSQELERLVYYKGDLIIFYLWDTDEFFFMPYALDGGLDFYNRFAGVHPIPVNGTNKAQAEYLSQLKLKPVYKPLLNVTLEDFKNSCVILHDYTPQSSQTCTPKANLMDPILDNMAEMIPMMNTCLQANTGVIGYRVQDQDQASSVIDANAGLKSAALNGQLMIPVVGQMDFQDLPTNGNSNPDIFMQAYQSLDNYRLSLHGITNGGQYADKSQYVNNTQTAMNSQGSVNLVQQDATLIRQNFCNIVNSIWGTNLWYEPSEALTMVDVNGDGVLYNRDLGEENSNESEL